MSAKSLPPARWMFCVWMQNTPPLTAARLMPALRVLRSADMASLVRIPGHSVQHIQSALDSGATGIVVPHVSSRAQAEFLAQACHFGPGGRGFSGSTRAAGFGQVPMAEHQRLSSEQTTLIAQIEDIEGVELAAEIAAVENIDALFIGRIDLTVALQQADSNAAAVIGAVERICAAGVSSGAAIGMFFSDMSEQPRWRRAGASLFLLESDQSFLRQGAVGLRERFASRAS
ncbi:MAG: aldolase/citrate lyase family protein [Chromatocurvus sp.]